MRRISLPEIPKKTHHHVPSGPPLLPKSPTVTLTPPPAPDLCTTPASDSLPSPPATHESLERKESRRSTVSSSSGGGPSRSRANNALHNPREKRRRKIVIIIAVTAVALFVMCVLLIAVTLKLTPSIDEKIRKENEAMLKIITQSNVNAQAEHRPDNGSTGTSTSTARPPNSEG